MNRKFSKMWNFILILFATLSVNAIAETPILSCKAGGQSAKKNYRYALDLLSSGKRLSEAEEDKVLILLEQAVKNRCHQAALTLVEIRANQMAASSAATGRLDVKLDDEIYALLIKATELDEGWFELGSYLVTNGSRHYDPQRARYILEKAAADGDDRAKEFLISSYGNGLNGFPTDKGRAAYWNDRLQSK